MARRGAKILLAVFLFLCIGVLWIAGYVFWRMRHGPDISARSVLQIHIEGEMPEYSTPPLFSHGGGHHGTSMWDLREALEKAAVDKRIAAVWVWIDYPAFGWGKVEEIISCLDRFKSRGKPLIGYINASDERGYSIALACDEIDAPPDAYLELNGIAAEITHYPGLLEKLGIRVQFERFGKYKSVSGEKMGRKDLSEPVREMINSLLDSQYSTLVDRISARRKLPKQKVLEVLDHGGFTARGALAAGFIDRDRDEVAVGEFLRGKVGESGKLKIVRSSEYRDVPRKAVGLHSSNDRIAVVFVQGLIVQGRGEFNPIFFEEEDGSDRVIHDLDEAADDPATKAIVLRVDSPGGAGFGPDLICNKIVELQKKKPVIVSMSDYAASGGYWVSMPARKIVAEPSTITGSIGVWSVFPDFSELHAKLGLNVDVLKRGKHADMLLADRPLDPDERALFRQMVLDMYNHFVQRAAELRRMPLAQMEEIAQGRSWLGSQARQNGLVDELGGLDRAIELAKKEAALSGTPELWLPGEKGFFERLGEILPGLSRSLTLESAAQYLEEQIREIQATRAYEVDPDRVTLR